MKDLSLKSLKKKKPHLAERDRLYVSEAMFALSKECVNGVKAEQIIKYILIKYGVVLTPPQVGGELRRLATRGVIYCKILPNKRRIWFVHKGAPMVPVRYEELHLRILGDLDDQLRKVSGILKIPKAHLAERALRWGLSDYLRLLLEEHQKK